MKILKGGEICFLCGSEEDVSTVILSRKLDAFDICKECLKNLRNTIDEELKESEDKSV